MAHSGPRLPLGGATLCTTYVLRRLGIVPVVLAAVGKAEVVHRLLMRGVRDALSEPWTCDRRYDRSGAVMVIARRIGKCRSSSRNDRRDRSSGHSQNSPCLHTSPLDM